MSDLPRSVEFHEEGPREGFQFEPRTYPLERRRDVVMALARTGLKQIQVASFVHPKRVPQMADAEALFESLTPVPGVDFTGLWLNEQGYVRATRAKHIRIKGSLSFYASDAFSRSNNNLPAAEMRDRQREWIRRYLDDGVALEAAHLMTAFGCNQQGEVPVGAVTDLVRWLRDACAEVGAAVPPIVLCDTVGHANPEAVRRRVGAVRELLPDVRVGLHLHDTRGLGAANVYAALQMGVDLFDSSVGGLGGCPFCGHTTSAAGNVCTEDMVFMCHELGIETGIDLEALIEAARLAESVIGHPLAGHVMHAGSLRGVRTAAA